MQTTVFLKVNINLQEALTSLRKSAFHSDVNETGSLKNQPQK